MGWGREAHRRNEARIGRFNQGQRAESPAPKAGYKTAICLPVIPKSVLAFREASIQYPMAFGLNRVELIGRLGADVTVNHLASGGRVANLSVATDESYINKSLVS